MMEDKGGLALDRCAITKIEHYIAPLMVKAITIPVTCGAQPTAIAIYVASMTNEPVPDEMLRCVAERLQLPLPLA